MVDRRVRMGVLGDLAGPGRSERRPRRGRRGETRASVRPGLRRLGCARIGLAAAQASGKDRLYPITSPGGLPYPEAIRRHVPDEQPGTATAAGDFHASPEILLPRV